MKLTCWFSGDQKPVRVGVYQQMNGMYLGYQYWDGKLWRGFCGSPQAAYNVRKFSPAADSHQNDKWRGVAK